MGRELAHSPEPFPDPSFLSQINQPRQGRVTAVKEREMIRMIVVVLLSVVLAAVLLCGCPGPVVKADPYSAAHIAINRASLVLPVAEGIFNQWLYAQPKLDSPKVKRARVSFSRAMTVASNALKLAHDGVDLAKQAKEDPDIGKLLRLSDAAWGDLRDFLDTLLAGGSPGIIVDVFEEVEPSGPDAIEVRVLDLTVNKNPIDALPASLIP